MKMCTILLITLTFAALGMLDAGYLTKEHYSNVVPPCSVGSFADCGRVLRSEYAMIGPVPLAALGLLYYSTVFALLAIRLNIVSQQTWSEKMWQNIQGLVGYTKRWGLPDFLKDFQLLLTSIGVLTSAYLMYLQLGVIHAICIYCTASAFNSVILFSLTLWERSKK